MMQLFSQMKIKMKFSEKASKSERACVNVCAQMKGCAHTNDWVGGLASVIRVYEFECACLHVHVCVIVCVYFEKVQNMEIKLHYLPSLS